MVSQPKGERKQVSPTGDEIHELSSSAVRPASVIVILHRSIWQRFRLHEARINQPSNQAMIKEARARPARPELARDDRRLQARNPPIAISVKG